MSKIKVLMLADFLCSTGFAQVAHNVAAQLHNTGKYEIDVVAINYYGDPYDTKKYPYNVYPAVHAGMPQRYSDLYGRQRFLDMMGELNHDILFVIQDSFILDKFIYKIQQERAKLEHKDRHFATVVYYPIDAEPKTEWLEKGVDPADFPVTYTQYAYKESTQMLPDLDGRLKYIYHGTDTSIFKPLPDRGKLRKDFKMIFPNMPEDPFIFMNINRNQQRKDIFSTMKAFSIVKKKRPNAFLYLHMQPQDSGGDLFDIDKQLGLVAGEDWGFPQNFSANKGYPIEAVNELYNVADCVVSSTLGEGWGFSSIEGMATKTPILFPNHTSLTEIIGDEERGTFIAAGNTMSHFVCLGESDNNRIRPTVDVTDMAKKMIFVMDNADKPIIQERTEAAYTWATNLTWDHVGKQWLDVFDNAWKKVQIMRGNESAPDRNSLCFCGSGRKYKKCCGRIWSKSIQ